MRPRAPPLPPPSTNGLRCRRRALQAQPSLSDRALSACALRGGTGEGPLRRAGGDRSEGVGARRLAPDPAPGARWGQSRRRWSPGRSRPRLRPQAGAGSRRPVDLPVSVYVPAQGDMETCLAAAALNGVDRRSLQRSARLGQEVLERAKRRAVDWRSLELPKGSVGVISRERPYQESRPAVGPWRLLPGEVRALCWGSSPFIRSAVACRGPGHATQKHLRDPVLGGSSKVSGQ